MEKNETIRTLHLQELYKEEILAYNKYIEQCEEDDDILDESEDEVSDEDMTAWAACSGDSESDGKDDDPKKNSWISYSATEDLR